MNKVIDVNGKQVTIDKLPLKRYAELLAAVQELPQHVELFKGKTESDLLQMLPELVTTAYPDVSRVIQVVTQLSQEEVDKMGLDDLVAILEAFFEVNNYSKIYEAIKKVMTRTGNLTPKLPETENQTSSPSENISGSGSPSTN